MTLYFFHIRSSGVWVDDDEGTEMANADEARLEAIRDIRELVSRILMTAASVPWDDAIEVTTIEGRLFEISFREAVGL